MEHWNVSSVNTSCLTENTKNSVLTTATRSLSRNVKKDRHVHAVREKKWNTAVRSAKTEVRKDADRKETFRGRKAGDGKEFTRERRKEFKYKEDSKPRTPRPSTDDGRPKAAPAPRYMHRRRSEEEGNSQD